MGKNNSKIKESIYELDRILGDVKSHFLYSGELENRIIKALSSDALCHSNKLEPDIDHRVTLSRLEEARDFAENNFPGYFDEEFVCKIANYVHPFSYSYRDSSARVTGITGEISLMTNPAKLKREMQKLYDRINSSSNHPAFRAIEFSLYFLLVHPFKDGNGRTGRLLQNIYLEKNSLPPVIVHHTDRITYMRHIEDAQIGYKRRDNSSDLMFKGRSCGELRYFEYMIDHIKRSAEDVQVRIKNLKKFNLKTKIKGSPRGIYGVRNAIQETIGAIGKFYEVSCSPKNGEMEIVTDASEELLLGTLQKYKTNKSCLTKYKLSRLG